MDDQRLVTGHIFENGHSLFTPLPGTTGFTRLFAREHGQYLPTNAETEALVAELASEQPQTQTSAEETPQ
jgi:hypothetical protein